MFIIILLIFLDFESFFQLSFHYLLILTYLLFDIYHTASAIRTVFFGIFLNNF